MEHLPPMLQNAREFADLLAVYREHKPERVLEVGVWHGGTLRHWLDNAVPGAMVVALDDRHRNEERYREWTPAGVTIIALTGTSQDKMTRDHVKRLGPFDFVFIDADHRYECVKADWEFYGLECTRPGAIVALHDIRADNPRSPEIQVRKLWGEIVDGGLYDWDEISYERGKWLGIGVVHL